MEIDIDIDVGVDIDIDIGIHMHTGGVYIMWYSCTYLHIYMYRCSGTTDRSGRSWCSLAHAWRSGG